MKNKFSVLVLAAGAGTRMKSALPKVLHPVCEMPMILRVLKTVSKLKPVSLGVVVGHGGAEVVRTVRESCLNGGSDRKGPDFIRQKVPKGSGHAVRSAAGWLKKISAQSGKSHPAQLLVLCADIPLISEETLRDLVQTHEKEGHCATLCSMEMPNPFGYGRILRDARGEISKIIEEKDATEQERRVGEVNTGLYCFNIGTLLEILPKLKNNNAKKEYYLTDVVELCRDRGYGVGSFKVDASRDSRFRYEALGINTREDLAMAEKLFQEKVLSRWMREGVNIPNPGFTYIGEKVSIGKDTTILPGTQIFGKTKIGQGCKIGPHSLIEDSEIGDNVTIRASFVYGSKIRNGAQVGPFTHLRPTTLISEGARIGNFTEVKNSRVGRGTKVSHLAYVGDAFLGDEINVGAGAITCNFDGKNKNRTVIGSKSFIGSNVNLIAPVRIGAGTVVGAGSTITKNVPPNSLAIERSEQIIKQGWAKKKKNKSQKIGRDQ